MSSLSSFVPLDLASEIAWYHRREGPVTGDPEGGKRIGKPQSSSDPEEPEPELSDPEPELPEPEPESSDPEPGSEESEPELSSEPEGSSDAELPPWSSTDADGVADRLASEGLGSSEGDGPVVSVGCTTLPT
jgi:hypothetical protein